jgi:ABC-type Fe3+-hydroxamate transport system substrate-binding protein
VGENPETIVIVDALGDELRLAGPPKRIVSLVPSVSETLIDLGAGRRLVGITGYCVHPADAVASIAKVGGTKGFSFDKIDLLEPDLVIGNKEENRKTHIDRLREKYPVFVTYPRTVKEAIEMVRDLGTLTGTQAKAEEFAEACVAAISLAAGLPPDPRRTACLIWRDPWMAAGPDTYMSDLLETTGFENVFSAADGRYPETTLEAIVEHVPDVIILPDEPYEFGEKDEREIRAFLKEKGHRADIVLMDGSYLTWFGMRTLLGLEHLGALTIKLRE